ncbi:MAG: class I SAM-dependent methyltransferase, partial [Candidatus Kariarchaeaceae archaeon]|jgi:SAM-dependent methyltransferase
VKYRPRYPEELLQVFKDKMGLTPNHVMADVGSGTGISAELFVKNGNTVYAVEPNYEMRGAAEIFYANSTYPGQFVSVDGTAEYTGLPTDSVDFVIAGQALHWFDQDLFLAEIGNILKPDGWLGFFWNSRSLSAGFNMDYNHFLERFSVDFEQTDEKRFRQTRMHKVFESLTVEKLTNRQIFDLNGLQGRYLSSSYAPKPDSPEYQPMLKALEALFNAHQKKGSVIFNYDVELYYGKLPKV